VCVCVCVCKRESGQRGRERSRVSGGQRGGAQKRLGDEA